MSCRAAADGVRGCGGIRITSAGQTLAPASSPQTQMQRDVIGGVSRSGDLDSGTVRPRDQLL